MINTITQKNGAVYNIICYFKLLIEIINYSFRDVIT